MTPKMKKVLMVSIPCAVVAIVAIVVAVILLGGGNGYRRIQVYRIDGGANVERGAEEKITPYVNMLLESNDVVKTLGDGYLYLKLDDDKFLMAEPNSHFELIATGDAKNSKTRIELKCGAVTVHITNPLSAGSDFEVGTGNSTMAVRGTSFRVDVTEDGESTQTTVQVFGGEVSVQPMMNGSTVGESESITADCEAVVTTTDEGVEVEKNEEPLQLPDLDEEILDFLKEGIENGNDVGASAEEIDRIIADKQKTFTVTFVFGDTVFATERVAYGQTAKIPALMPTPQGAWDFDFSTEITADVTVRWVEQAE